jgi:acyl-CoA synthetase (AMP-forming)/AMP-acid ligase II
VFTSHLQQHLQQSRAAPTSNVGVILLDPNGSRDVITQPGVTGEIYISGPQLSAGYHNLPDVTAERFVVLPHLAMHGVGPEPWRFYRTGDLGMWQLSPSAAAAAAGQGQLVLHLVGRAQGMDTTVKVNGYMVSICSVTQCAALHPSCLNFPWLVEKDRCVQLQ